MRARACECACVRVCVRVRVRKLVQRGTRVQLAFRSLKKITADHFAPRPKFGYNFVVGNLFDFFDFQISTLRLNKTYLKICILRGPFQFRILENKLCLHCSLFFVFVLCSFFLFV